MKLDEKQAKPEIKMDSKLDADDFGSDEDLDNIRLDSEDDEDHEALDYYKEVEEAQTAKKNKKQKKADITEVEIPEEEEDEEELGKRMATYKILKNKGLTPHRKKENRNPRVKRRVKYETAQKRLKDFRRVAVDKSRVGSYGGEKSGIKTNLSRGVRL